MYNPPAFREDRPSVLRALMRAHPLATLITAGKEGLTANLIPFSVVETGSGDLLHAHLARANEQVNSLRSGAEVLIIFQGPQAYITPSWYATKAEHGKVVPTWNYVVVQARGIPSIVERPDWLSLQLFSLTAEQEDSREAPWTVADAPKAYIEAQMRGIVGLEVPISRIEGKWKVSQNQPATNRASVSRGLHEATQSAMAAIVQERGDVI